MNRKVATSTSVSVLLLLAVVGIGFNPLVAATPDPTLYIDPPSVTGTLGQSFTVDIWIKDLEEASHLVAWDLWLGYNTTLLNASASEEGPFLIGFWGSGSTFYFDIFNDTEGYVFLGSSFGLLPYLPSVWPYGTGVLATITFHCTGLGECSLDPYYHTMLLGVYPNETLYEIPHYVEGGYVIQKPIPGDVNADGIVDISDIIIAALAFGSKPSDPKWDQRADQNGDNLIDIFDLVTIGIHFGETYP